MTNYIEVESYNGSRSVELESHFLKESKVFLTGVLDDAMAEAIVKELMYLENEKNAHGPVRLYINSPGGNVSSGMMIYDVLQMMHREVDLYCVGLAASMAAVIFASGQKGHRFILPHASTMIHEPSISGINGGSNASSIYTLSKSIQRTKKMISSTIVKHTGQTPETIERLMREEKFLSAEESISFGICDGICQSLI